ncbi:MAG: pyridine nucleotide-disulfide oxidoreductase [Gammaproteobacteria bacterium]|nr:MAG: pyridine nucleotide-disulfide oxidoreductase [Gammaproteobacteria bacterium]
MQGRVIIVGGSHAAAQLAPSLRKEGWEGEIVVIGDEGGVPYQRPPLSKEYLSGNCAEESLAIRPGTAYEQHGIELRSGRVDAIDRTAKRVLLADGESIEYQKLALCTGARVRRLSVPGADLAGVHYLRTLADVNAIRAQLTPGSRVVIVGGGYIGLESAAALRKQGLSVTVLEVLPRVLERVTAPQVSAFYQRVHAEEGVEILTGWSVAAIEGDSAVTAVVSDDGRRLPADLVIVGIGVVPNVELAEACGLKVDNGIWVDEYAATADPDIFAAGDCTNHPNRLLGRRIRLESVPNAMEQAKSAAAGICGRPHCYDGYPWFWSDQYDLKLQIAGLSQGYDRVVLRGNPAVGRSFVAWYLCGDRLVAADCINRPREFMVAKQLLARGVGVDGGALSDDSFNLKDLL